MPRGVDMQIITFFVFLYLLGGVLLYFLYCLLSPHASEGERNAMIIILSAAGAFWLVSRYIEYRFRKGLSKISGSAFLWNAIRMIIGYVAIYVFGGLLTLIPFIIREVDNQPNTGTYVRWGFVSLLWLALAVVAIQYNRALVRGEMKILAIVALPLSYFIMKPGMELPSLLVAVGMIVWTNDRVRH